MCCIGEELRYVISLTELRDSIFLTFPFSSYSSFGGSVGEGDTDQDEDTYGAKKAGVNLGWIATVSNREG